MRLSVYGQLKKTYRSFNAVQVDLKKRKFLLNSLSGLGLTTFSWIPFSSIAKLQKMLSGPYSFNVVTEYPKGMNEKEALDLIHQWDDSNKREKLLNRYRQDKSIVSEDFLLKGDHCIWKIVFKNKESHDEFLRLHRRNNVVDDSKWISSRFDLKYFSYLEKTFSLDRF